MRSRMMSSSIVVLSFAAHAAHAAHAAGSPTQLRDAGGTTHTPSPVTQGVARAHASQDGGLRDTLSAADSLLIARGREIVTTLCAACHVEASPHKLAPPLSHVSNRYRMQLVHRDSALARITAWIKEPARDRSLMPAQAIERFGLMAPLPIPEEQRRAAAAYVWSLSEGAAAMEGMRGGRGMQGEKGMKGSERRAGTRDTLATPPRKG
ncbi:MAG: cytochrome c [Gemmatimonadaceae bacterium]|nr:cytochrome c [Gemmatimonadaceae bacterium]